MQTYKATRPPEPPHTGDSQSLLAYIQRLHQWILQDNLAVEKAANRGSDSLPARYLTAAPSRPQDGAILLADGTSWNPGSGKGAYRVSISGTTVTYTFLG